MSLDKKSEIVAVAEKLIRSGGYYGFSFREIAKLVGVKSASVHYYFPTKADLGAYVAREYTDCFLGKLGDVEAIISHGEDPLRVYFETFKLSFLKDKKMCLCGLLGMESDVLPEELKIEVKRFFDLNINWLSVAYKLKGSSESQAQALRFFALLEGGMLVCKVSGDFDAFDWFKAA